MNAQPRKRRTAPHIMEEESVTLLKAALPMNWVLREYRPDYGLDYAVEVFEEVPDLTGTFESLGEHFFIQLKSVKTLTSQVMRVPPRMNVAKHPLSQPPTKEDAKTFEAVVIPFSIETTLLNTVQAMGVAVVVHLVLVALDERRVFYVCLSDYIDKVIVPQGDHLLKQDTVTVHVPLRNELSRNGSHAQALDYVRFFAKRAKFYSAFNLFAYQLHELGYCDDADDRRRMASHFIKLLRDLDIWNSSGWPIVDDYRRWLLHLESVLPAVPDQTWFTSHPWTKFLPNAFSHGIPLELLLDQNIIQFWEGLNVLGRNYEEVCREFALPTWFEMLRTVD